MNETFIPSSTYSQKNWYLIDCKNLKLGRLASSLNSILSGKHKMFYYPGFDLGEYIILINTSSIIINKKYTKYRVFKPGRPGRSLKKVSTLLLEPIILDCVKAMLPKGKSKKNITKRLKIYGGKIHPHQAQNPFTLTL